MKSVGGVVGMVCDGEFGKVEMVGEGGEVVIFWVSGGEWWVGIEGVYGVDGFEDFSGVEGELVLF